MNRVVLWASAWFSISLSIIICGVWFGLQYRVFFLGYLLVNSLFSIFFWKMTEIIKREKRPPLSSRAFIFIVMLIFGALGYLVAILVHLYLKFDEHGVYQEYREYIRMKWDGIEFEKKNYELILREYSDREPIIDSLKYGDEESKRGAVEVLARMGDAHAIRTLKGLTSDVDPYVRFIASSKLEMIEKKYVEEMDWYMAIISIVGNDRELLLQYGYLILEFLESGFLDEDIVHVYGGKGEKIFRFFIDDGRYENEARAALVSLLRIVGRYGEAIEESSKLDDKFSILKIDEQAECYFQLRDFTNLKRLILECKNGGDDGSIVAEWFASGKLLEDGGVK